MTTQKKRIVRSTTPSVPPPTYLKIKGKTHTLYDAFFLDGEIAEDSADVKFICKDGEVLAHKIFLSQFSQFFADIFCDTKNEEFLTIVNVPDIDENTMRLIAKLAYTRELNVSKEEMDQVGLFISCFGIKLDKFVCIKEREKFRGKTNNVLSNLSNSVPWSKSKKEIESKSKQSSPIKSANNNNNDKGGADSEDSENCFELQGHSRGSMKRIKNIKNNETEVVQQKRISQPQLERILNNPNISIERIEENDEDCLPAESEEALNMVRQRMVTVGNEDTATPSTSTAAVAANNPSLSAISNSPTKSDSSSNNIHQCTFCKVKFLTRTKYEWHKVRHVSSRAYKCGSCKMIFNSAQKVYQHEMKDHRNKRPDAKSFMKTIHILNSSDNITPTTTSTRIPTATTSTLAATTKNRTSVTSNNRLPQSKKFGVKLSKKKRESIAKAPALARLAKLNKRKNLEENKISEKIPFQRMRERRKAAIIASNLLESNMKRDLKGSDEDEEEAEENNGRENEYNKNEVNPDTIYFRVDGKTKIDKEEYLRVKQLTKEKQEAEMMYGKNSDGNQNSKISFRNSNAVEIELFEMEEEEEVEGVNCPICKITMTGLPEAVDHLNTIHKDENVRVTQISSSAVRCMNCNTSLAICEIIAHISICKPKDKSQSPAKSIKSNSPTTTPSKLSAVVNTNDIELNFDGVGVSPLNQMECDSNEILTLRTLRTNCKCQVCGKESRKMGEIAKCLRGHGIIRCGLCFNTYKNRLSYNHHLQLCHETEDGRFKCPIESCDKDYLNAGQVTAHMNSSHWLNLVREKDIQDGYNGTRRGRKRKNDHIEIEQIEQGQEELSKVIINGEEMEVMFDYDNEDYYNNEIEEVPVSTSESDVYGNSTLVIDKILESTRNMHNRKKDEINNKSQTDYGRDEERLSLNPQITFSSVTIE